MIRLILKIIWNQRRQNGWILIEMILVGFFLWKATGKIFETEYTLNLSPGYNEHGVYEMQIGEYHNDYDLYEASADNDSARIDNMKRIINRLRQRKEVSSIFIPQGNSSIPNGDCYTSFSIKIDSTDCGVQTFDEIIFDGTDIFKTYEMHDAYTGRLMKKNSSMPQDKCVYISKSLAEKYYKGVNPIGKMSLVGDSLLKVAGVFSDIQTRCNKVPKFLAVFPIKVEPMAIHGFYVCFRLKSDVNATDFEKYFSQNISPKLSIGNFYLMQMQSLKKQREYQQNISGSDNTLRYNILMSGFFLLCTFIGMVGTFWIRSNNRRGDIGMMKSMGCSQSRIVRQFLTESWMLTTISFILAVVWRLNVEYYGDFFKVDAIYADSPYLTYHPIMLFLINSGLTYLIMLAIALIGTYIPVRRAARTLPAESLRDE